MLRTNAETLEILSIDNFNHRWQLQVTAVNYFLHSHQSRKDLIVWKIT